MHLDLGLNIYIYVIMMDDNQKKYMQLTLKEKQHFCFKSIVPIKLGHVISCHL